MAWPIDEARRIPLISGRPVLFETGYGPSGLPHIGTFTEVARTEWVRDCFFQLTGLPTKLIAFSDDMDALRRVPENVPNKEMLEQHIGLPLSSVPNPFGSKYESFAFHNNAKLCEFLDQFGFEYEFASATHYYTSGRFNNALQRVLDFHAEIVDVILPTLGKDRADTYSPLMPIHPVTGHVMQVRIDAIDANQGVIHWRHDGEEFSTSIFNGNCKLQWKADWAMRWFALGVDYEMSGKDLIDSVKLSSQICKILGGRPPVNLTYELFLDEHGHKQSKSKGNGVSMEDWLRYGPPESLEHFVYGNPQRAKKLFLGMIPKATDEYLANRALLASQTPQEREENPAWYVHTQQVPEGSIPFTFSLLVNLVSVLNAEDHDLIWSYLRTYPSSWQSLVEDTALVDTMIANAIAYYQDFVKPKKVYRPPTDVERTALMALAEKLNTFKCDCCEGRGEVGGLLPNGGGYHTEPCPHCHGNGFETVTAETIQTEVYTIGNEHFKPLKGWFDCLYQVLLGQTEGPRFGLFVALYGINDTIKLIKEKLA